MIGLRVLAATLASSCTIYSDRDLTIDLAGTGAYETELRLTIRGEGGVPRAELRVDGVSVGLFDTNREIALDLSALSPGEHLLEAAVVDGAYRPSRARATFQVVRPLPEVVAVRPQPGGVAGDAPFPIEVEFSRAVNLDPSGDGRVTFGAVAVEPEWSADRRTLRIVAEPPPENLAYSVTAQLTDDFGRPVTLRAGPFFAVSLGYSFQQDVWTNGTVSLAPLAGSSQGGPEHLGGATLYAGSFPIAELGSPPWAPVDWDTRDVPEGTYELRVVAPGVRVTGPFPPRSVHVDRTPPFVSCSPAAPGPAPALDVWYGVRIAASEAMLNEAPALPANGEEVPSRAHGSLRSPPHAVSVELLAPRRPPPYTLTATAGALAVDLAGNPAVVSGCAFDVPVWLTPWGTGPIEAPAPVLASELALDVPRDGAYVPGGEPARATLAWIAPPTAPNADELCVVRRAVASSSPFVSLSRQASGVSTSRRRVAWTEAGTSVGLASWNAEGETWVDEAAPIDPAPSAAEPRLGASPTYGQDHLVWTETDGAGHRTLGGAWSESGGGWWTLQADVRLDPLDEVGHPATFYGFSAFLETVAGVPQVRAAQGWTTYWLTHDGTLNADPASPASDPTSAAGDTWAVAWVEGGRVQARILDRFLEGTPGEAEVLNVDPSRPARWPRATTSAGHPAVAFVEAGASGDEIWIRRYDGGAWTLLPGPVNADAPGTVAALAVSFGPSIAWADEAGHVRLRVYNQ